MSLTDSYHHYDRKTAEWLGEMHTCYSPQYNTPCVVALWNESADRIIAHCRRMGAIFHEDGPDDECFVVVLRPDIGPELWTESALRRGRRG
jgi:hypothetical protein